MDRHASVGGHPVKFDLTGLWPSRESRPHYTEVLDLILGKVIYGYLNQTAGQPLTTTHLEYFVIEEDQIDIVREPMIAVKSGTEDQLGVIAMPLVKLTAEVSGAYEPTAPVKFPDPERMAVQLIPTSDFHRLEEYRSDSTIFQNIFWSTISGIVGFLTSIFTSNQDINQPSFILIVILVIFAIIFGYLAHRANKRSQALTKKLLGEN